MWIVSQIAHLLLLATAVFIIGHTIRYAAWSNWQSTLAGKALLAQSITCSILVILAVIAIYTPPGHSLNSIARMAGYTFTLGLSVQTYLTLRHYQQINRDSAKDPDRDIEKDDIHVSRRRK